MYKRYYLEESLLPGIIVDGRDGDMKQNVNI